MMINRKDFWGILINKNTAADLIFIEEYLAEVKQAKNLITKKDFANAENHLCTALSINHLRPEAYNLLGVLYEFINQRELALKMYRTALDIKPDYIPSQKNLHRIVSCDYTIDSINMTI